MKILSFFFLFFPFFFFFSLFFFIFLLLLRDEYTYVRIQCVTSAAPLVPRTPRHLPYYAAPLTSVFACLVTFLFYFFFSFSLFFLCFIKSLLLLYIGTFKSAHLDALSLRPRFDAPFPPIPPPPPPSPCISFAFVHSLFPFPVPKLRSELHGCRSSRFHDDFHQEKS